MDFSFERVHGSQLYETRFVSKAGPYFAWAALAIDLWRFPRMIPPSPPDPSDSESPGVPGFRTWRGVYWFVFGTFVAVVVALTIFSRVYA